MKGYEISVHGCKIKLSNIRGEILRRVQFDLNLVLGQATQDVLKGFYGKKREQIEEHLRKYEIGFVKRSDI